MLFTIFLVVHGARDMVHLHPKLLNLLFKSNIHVLNADPRINVAHFTRRTFLLGFTIREGAADLKSSAGRVAHDLQELRALPTGQHLVHFYEDLLLLFQTLSNGIFVELILQILLIVEEADAAEPLVLLQLCGLLYRLLAGCHSRRLIRHVSLGLHHMLLL